MAGAEAPPASESARAGSSGADAAAKEPGAEMAAPYGTRSRNRTSNARPNYAEDKDIDMDNYDFYRGKDGHGGSKKSARQAQDAATNADALPRHGGGSRKSGTDDGRTAGLPQNGSRDHVTSKSGGGDGAGGVGGATGASQPAQSASLSGASQPSRKRKAAAVVATRRTSNAMQGTGPPLRETNLMTFEKCNYCPEQGRMKADDGTVLEANGKSSNTPLSPPPYQRHGEDPPTPRGREGNLEPACYPRGLPSPRRAAKFQSLLQHGTTKRATDQGADGRGARKRPQTPAHARRWRAFFF